jgi:hypothetical protein
VARLGIPISLTLTDQRAQRPEAALPIAASPMALTGLSASGPQEDPHSGVAPGAAPACGVPLGRAHCYRAAARMSARKVAGWLVIARCRIAHNPAYQKVLERNPGGGVGSG